MKRVLLPKVLLPKPVHGDTETFRMFLWWPRTLPNRAREWSFRWLEMADVRFRFGGWEAGEWKAVWEAVAWDDGTFPQDATAYERMLFGLPWKGKVDS